MAPLSGEDAAARAVGLQTTAAGRPAAFETLVDAPPPADLGAIHYSIAVAEMGRRFGFETTICDVASRS